MKRKCTELLSSSTFTSFTVIQYDFFFFFIIEKKLLTSHDKEKRTNSNEKSINGTSD